MQAVARQAVQPFAARACKSAYIISSSVLGVPLVLGIVAHVAQVLRGRQPQWDALLVAGLLPACWCFWLSRFRLIVADGTISYRNLFGTRTLPLAQVDYAEAVFDTSAQFRGPMQLRLIPYSGSGRRRIIVNMKVFGLQNLSPFIQILGTKFRDK